MLFYNDIFHHQNKRLKVRCPLWEDAIDRETMRELLKKHEESAIKNNSLIADSKKNSCFRAALTNLDNNKQDLNYPGKCNTTTSCRYGEFQR